MKFLPILRRFGPGGLVIQNPPALAVEDQAVDLAPAQGARRGQVFQEPLAHRAGQIRVKEAHQPGVAAAGLQFRQELRGQVPRPPGPGPPARRAAARPATPGSSPPRARVSRPRWMISPRSRGNLRPRAAAACGPDLGLRQLGGREFLIGRGLRGKGQRRLGRSVVILAGGGAAAPPPVPPRVPAPARSTAVPGGGSSAR